jgi:lysozyme
MTLTDLLIRHEGERLKPYVDTAGKLTIGVGHNLTDRGIPKEVSRMLLASDIADAASDAMKFPWYPGLCEARRAVILSMLFNLGLERFRGFVQFISAMIAADYTQARVEMLDSQWARQVGNRAVELATMMETGEWQKERR